MSALRTIVTRISLPKLKTCAAYGIRQIYPDRFWPSIPIANRRCFHNVTQNDQDFGEENEDQNEQRKGKLYDREFADMKVEDFEQLYRDEPELKEKIAMILGEYEYTKYNSMGRVPAIITVPEMNRLCKEGLTQNARDRIFNFLYVREMDKRYSKRRRDEEKKATRARIEARNKTYESIHGDRRSGLLDANNQLMYGLWHNTLLCRVPERKMKSGISDSRLRAAAMFGRKLIFDFDFADYMTEYAYKNVIDQVQEAYGINRYGGFDDPLDIWFCNLKRNSMAERFLEEHALTNLYSGSMVTVKEDCFTNYFDKSRLVYLSPDAREPLGKIVKSDDIYIIGVYNDKGHSQPVSHRKALKLGIRTKCLPLDSHVVWQGPSKALCVNHVTGMILETLSNGNDWRSAIMKHVPQRKIKPMELVMEEEQKRLARARNIKKKRIFNLREDLDL